MEKTAQEIRSDATGVIIGVKKETEPTGGES